MKRFLALALALVLCFALAACGGKTTTTDTPTGTTDPNASTTPEETLEPLGDPIKIGVLLDLTGGESTTGEEVQRAVNFAFKNLADRFDGDTPVFGNRPIEVYYGDCQSDQGATNASSEASRLIDDVGVVAIIAPVQAGQKGGAMEVCETAGIPYINSDGTPGNMVDFAVQPITGKYEWLVGAGGMNNQQPSAAAKYMLAEGIKTVTIMTADNIGFLGFADTFTSVFEAGGGSVVEVKAIAFGTADFASYFTTLKSCDAIAAWFTASMAQSFWRDYAAQNISVPVYGFMGSAFTDYTVAPKLEETNAAAAEKMIGTVIPMAYAQDIDNEANKAFVAAWEEEFGEKPAAAVDGNRYMAVQLIKAALEATDYDTTPDVLLEALLNTPIDGPNGHLEFAEGSNLATIDIYMVKTVKLADGQWNYEIVETYEAVPPAGLK